jgi:hypothetical protein
LRAACYKAEHNSFIISDHAHTRSISFTTSVRALIDEINHVSEFKNLRLFPRPFFKKLREKDVDLHEQLRYRVYSRAHAAARMVGLKLIDPKLLKTHSKRPPGKSQAPLQHEILRSSLSSPVEGGLCVRAVADVRFSDRRRHAVVVQGGANPPSPPALH